MNNLEKEKTAINGYLMLFVLLGIVLICIKFIVEKELVLLIPIIFISLFMLIGLTIVNPNDSRVLVLFGKYKGTLKSNGFKWVNPFMARKKVTLKARNFDSTPIKVNDKLGNPIMIGMVLVWKVQDTFKALFEVDQYETFVKIQSESALRKLAGIYPYDNMDHEHEISLRSGGEEVNHQLENELRERLEIAGIEVLEARISSLAYSSEIAGAMLQRQQAIAVVSARQKIVEGAVGMVEMALNQLSEKQIIELDDDKKAAMVSNLMVVLCSDKSASPVINTGTLHQ
ncbi:MAG: SPFH domain-containing protein [Flavobacteriia bacterium]|nr:SPFH domain-containing protein [Flavobacteriia bacterium]